MESSIVGWCRGQWQSGAAARVLGHGFGEIPETAWATVAHLGDDIPDDLDLVGMGQPEVVAPSVALGHIGPVSHQAARSRHSTGVESHGDEQFFTLVLWGEDFRARVLFFSIRSIWFWF
jgi:hypothetical protein